MSNTLFPAKERGRAERVNPREFRDLVLNSPMGIFTSTPEGRFLFANPAMASMFGYESPEELLESVTDIAAQIYADPADRQELRRLLELYGQVANHECRLLRRQGTWFWGSINVRTVQESEKGFQHYQGFIIDITESKKHRQMLQEQYRRMENILQCSNLGTWEWNVQTGETSFNETWADLVGYTLEELSPVSIQTWEMLAHPHDLKKSQELLKRHLSEELPYYDCECRMKHKLGHWVWIRDRGKIITRTPDEKPLLMFGTHWDITQRKQAEAALDLERSQLLAVFDSLSEYVYVSDPYTYEILFANKSLKKTFSKEFVGGVCYEELHNRSSPCEFCTNEIILQNKGEPHQWEYYNPFVDRHLLLTDRIIKWPDGRDVRLEVALDITERRRTEIKLKESEEKHRSMMEQSLDMVYLHDLEGNFLEVNQAAVSRTGYSREELLSMDVFDLHPEQSGRREILRQWQKWRPGQPAILEMVHVDKEGREFPVEINTGKVCFGNREYILALVRDISERKQTETALKESRERYQYLLQSSRKMQSFHNIIGRSREMQSIYTLLQQVAGVDTTVLITGETGTGKELIVDALHATSHRSTGPLIKVNCLTLAEELLDSELFGHVRGAFTGAYYDKTGRVEAAQGGTLFLDEIGDLTPRIQLKLLRFLQEREYQRVGESETRKADVRVVAATNADLGVKVKQGSFRKDLYYRLKVMSIHMPRLQERREDILLLINHFCRHFAEAFNKPIKNVSPGAMRLLLEHSWPGNVRELEHAMEHGVLLCPGGMIGPEHLPYELRIHDTQGHLKKSGQKVCRESLVRALQTARGNRTDAARILGISRRTLYRKLHKFKLE